MAPHVYTVELRLFGDPLDPDEILLRGLADLGIPFYLDTYPCAG